MKTIKFYTTLILLVSISTAFSQSYTKVNAPWINNPFDITKDFKHTLKDFRLFGKVKMIVSDKGKDTITFDRKGRVLKVINYNGNGKIMSQMILEYKKNKIIQKGSTFYYRPNEESIHLLDSKNRIIESYKKLKSNIKLIFKYNKNNNLISVKNTEYNSIEKYAYNSKRQLIDYKYISKEGEIYSSKAFDYNKYNSNKELIVNSEYEGQKSTFSIKYDGFGNIDKNHYKYDKKGNWIVKFNDYTDEKRTIIYYK